MAKWLWAFCDAVSWVVPVVIAVIALYAANRFALWQSSGNSVPTDEIKLITTLFWFAIGLCIILFVARYAIALRENSEKEQQQKLEKLRKETIIAIGNYIEQADALISKAWSISRIDNNQISLVINDIVNWELGINSFFKHYNQSFAQVFNAAPSVGVASPEKINEPIQLRKWVEFRRDKLFEILRIVA